MKDDIWLLYKQVISLFEIYLGEKNQIFVIAIFVLIKKIISILETLGNKTKREIHRILEQFKPHNTT